MPRTYGKVKQTRLAFAPVAASSSPGFEHSPGGSPDRLARLRYDRPSKPFIRRGAPRIEDYLTRRRENLSPDSPAGSKLFVDETEPLTEPGNSSQAALTDGEDSQVKVTGISSPCPLIKLESTSDVSSDEDIIMVTTRRQRRQTAADSEDGVDVDRDEKKKGREKSSRMKSKKTKTENNPPPTRDLRCRQRQKNAEATLKNTPSRHTRSAARRSALMNPPDSAERTSRRKSSLVNLSDLGSPETSDADEIVTLPPRRSRPRATQKRALVVDDESDESDPVVSSPTKRRRRNIELEAPHTPRPTSEQDKLDLEEDLEDLQDSVVKVTRTRGQLANSARLKRQQQLEALRRRRAGQRAQSVAESEESESAAGGSETSESEPEKTRPPPQHLDDTDESDVEPLIPSDEDLDRYEDDFVLEDEKAELGVPTDIPFEFTRHAYKQTKEYFRDAVEWMVHNKLNPAFARADTLYEVAFIKLEDEVKGRTGSQLVSTVWNSGFHRALMARPHIEVTLYPVTEGHPCDACNRSGHPASFDIKFYGKAYSLETLEPLSDEESDEDDRGTEERDRHGNVLPDENTRFLLGRHCKAKATMAHTLTHWRFHLNEWVVDYLERQGILADAKILERSHWSVRRQTKYANEIVDMMVQSGEVQKLWRDFHITLKAAREKTV